MCDIQLRSEISPTSDPGGQWFFLGYNASSSSGPFGNPPSNPLFPGTPVNGVIPGGDDPTVMTDGVTEGFYQVRYRKGQVPCVDFNTVTIEVLQVPCAGTGDIIVTCDDQFDVNMKVALSGPGCTSPVTDPAGFTYISTPDGNPPIFYGISPSFFDVSINLPGVYVIQNDTTTFTAPTFPTQAPCDDCDDQHTFTIELRSSVAGVSEATSPFIALTCDPNIPGDCQFQMADWLQFTPPSDTDVNVTDFGNWRWEGQVSPDGNTTDPTPISTTFRLNGAGVDPPVNNVYTVYGPATPRFEMSTGATNCLIDMDQADSGVIYRFIYQVYHDNSQNPGLCGQEFFIDVQLTHECGLECGGDFIQGDFVTDLNPTPLWAEYQTDPGSVDALVSTYHLISFEIGGVEQLVSSISLGAASWITLNGLPYLTNVVDTLNAQGFSDFDFNYSTAIGYGNQRYINVKAPNYINPVPCPDWSFIIGVPANQNSWAKYEANQISYGFNGVSYTRVSDPIVGGTSSNFTPGLAYLEPPIQNYVTGNDC